MPLNMSDTWFELSGKQQMHFETITNINHHIRNNYHALHSALWFKKINSQMPEREIIANHPMDACRVYGTLELNKVMGLFHILAGKPVNIMGQHGHALQFLQTGGKLA